MEIVRLLKDNPMRFADIANALGRSAREVMRELAYLEVNGKVVRMPDGRYRQATNSVVIRVTRSED